MHDVLTPEIEKALAEFAKEHQISRDEALKRILKDWLESYGLLPLEEEE